MNTTGLVLILVWMLFLIGLPFILDGLKVDRFKVVWGLFWFLAGMSFIFGIRT